MRSADARRGPTGWEDADFVFVPAIALGTDAAPRLDLALNMVSFQEMTTEQVEAYVRPRRTPRAARSSTASTATGRRYNRELTNVREMIGRYYWPHEVAVLDGPYRLPVRHSLGTSGGWGLAARTSSSTGTSSDGARRRT